MRLKHLLFSASAAACMALSSCSPYSLVNSEVYNNADLADYHTFRIITPGEGKLPSGMEMVTYYNIAAAIREQMVERGFTEDAASPLIINLGITVNKEISTAPLSWVTPPPAPAPMPMPAPAPAPAPGAGNGGPVTLPAPVGGRPVATTAQAHFFPYHGPAPVPPAAPFFMMPRQMYWNNAYYSNAQVITGIYKEGVLTMDFVNIDTKTPLYSASVATIIENGDAQFRNLSGIAQAVQTLFKRFPVPLLPQYRSSK